MQKMIVKRKLEVKHEESNKEQVKLENNVLLADQKIATKEEVVESFNDLLENEKNIIRAFVYYTSSKIYGYTGDIYINGKTAEDIVMTSIEKILSCKRKWDKNKFENIKHFTFVVINSELKNEAKKLGYEQNPLYDKQEESEIKQNNNTKNDNPIFIPIYKIDSEGEIYDITDKQVAKEYINNYYKDTEEESYKEEIKELLINELFNVLNEKNDIVAYTLLMEKLKPENNHTKANIKVAKYLGVTVEEVEAAYQRIKRLGKKILRGKKWIKN